MYKKMTRPLQFLSVLGLLIAGNALMNHQCQAISKQISQNICMCGISAGYKLGCNESGTGCGVIPDSPTPCASVCENLAANPRVKLKWEIWQGTDIVSLNQQCEEWRGCPNTGKIKDFKSRL